MIDDKRSKSNSAVRDRVDTIFQSVEEIQEKFEKFSSRVVILVLIVFVMSGVSIAGFAYALHRIQSSRLESSERGCLLRNGQNKGILTVFRKFHITDRELIVLFPVQSDCEQYAKDATK